MSKKTLDTITESCNDFLIQVKANCSGLLRCMKESAENEMVIDTYETYDNQNGREEFRYYDLYPLSSEATQWLTKNKWKNINRIIKVRRFGTRDNKNFDETAWYILSKCSNNAEVYAKGIRGHWNIENKLHYVKDVYFKEDDMPMVNSKKATVIAIFNTIAINLLKINQIDIKNNTFDLFVNKIDKIFDFVKNIL